jgi:hypothetical protein
MAWARALPAAAADRRASFCRGPAEDLNTRELRNLSNCEYAFRLQCGSQRRRSRKR